MGKKAVVMQECDETIIRLGGFDEGEIWDMDEHETFMLEGDCKGGERPCYGTQISSPSLCSSLTAT